MTPPRQPASTRPRPRAGCCRSQPGAVRPLRLASDEAPRRHSPRRCLGHDRPGHHRRAPAAEAPSSARCRSAGTLAIAIHVASTGPFVLYDYTQLEQNVARVATETDVAYAMILDRDGGRGRQPPARDRGNPLSGATLDRILSTDATVGPGAQRAGRRGADRLRGADPVDAERWAPARVGLSRHRMEAEIRRHAASAWSCWPSSSWPRRGWPRPWSPAGWRARAAARGGCGRDLRAGFERRRTTTRETRSDGSATAFNDMARQLHEQRSALLEQRTALEAADGEQLPPPVASYRT